MPHAYEHDDSESNGCCSSASDDGYEWGCWQEFAQVQRAVETVVNWKVGI